MKTVFDAHGFDGQFVMRLVEEAKNYGQTPEEFLSYHSTQSLLVFGCALGFSDDILEKYSYMPESGACLERTDLIKRILSKVGI